MSKKFNGWNAAANVSAAIAYIGGAINAGSPVTNVRVRWNGKHNRHSSNLTAKVNDLRQRTTPPFVLSMRPIPGADGVEVDIEQSAPSSQPSSAPPIASSFLYRARRALDIVLHPARAIEERKYRKFIRAEIQEAWRILPDHEASAIDDQAVLNFTIYQLDRLYAYVKAHRHDVIPELCYLETGVRLQVAAMFTPATIVDRPLKLVFIPQKRPTSTPPLGSYPATVSITGVIRNDITKSLITPKVFNVPGILDRNLLTSLIDEKLIGPADLANMVNVIKFSVTNGKIEVDTSAFAFPIIVDLRTGYAEKPLTTLDSTGTYGIQIGPDAVAILGVA